MNIEQRRKKLTTRSLGKTDVAEMADVMESTDRANSSRARKPAASRRAGTCKSDCMHRLKANPSALFLIQPALRPNVPARESAALSNGEMTIQPNPPEPSESPTVSTLVKTPIDFQQPRPRMK